MEKQRPLLPTIIILDIAMFIGFGILARIADASFLIVVVIGLVVAVVSVLLVWFAVKFDRQMRQLGKKHEEHSQT
ncbi:MAG TPA: hypothetical protein PLX25_08515 [Sphaerochaeta sp.]|nr:hypothetical protein [Sphaerochaeta sp.]